MGVDGQVYSDRHLPRPIEHSVQLPLQIVDLRVCVIQVALGLLGPDLVLLCPVALMLEFDLQLLLLLHAQHLISEAKEE